MVSGWLERKTDCYLMGQERDGLLHIYARKDMGERLETLRSVEPIGYRGTGKFLM